MGSTSALTDVQQNITLGLPVPPLPHAISVSLPTWRDNIGYEEGEKRVVDVMVSGYPRFFIHLSIQKVGRIPVSYLVLKILHLARQDIRPEIWRERGTMHVVPHSKGRRAVSVIYADSLRQCTPNAPPHLP